MRTRLKLTVEDLPTMPREDGRHWELIDGDPYLTTAPHGRHQATTDEINYALQQWNRRVHGGMVMAGPGVILSAADAVMPDVVWVRKERLKGIFDQDGKIHFAPDLVVEVLSPGSENARRDLVLKLRLYSDFGVREYWSVNWQTDSIAVYRLSADGQLDLAARLGAGDTLTSPMLPGFSASVAHLCNPLAELEVD